MEEPTQPDATLLTVAQTAEMLAVSVRTVNRMIERGELPAYRIGERSTRVKATDVARLLKPIQ